MVSGAVRPKKTFGKKVKDHQESIDELYGIVNSVTSQSGIPTGRISGGGSGSASVVEARFLQTRGGTMLGPIAFNPELAIIDSDGHIDITKFNETDSSYVLVIGAGNPDDLKYIDGAQYNGQYLVLQGTASQVLNLLHANMDTDISNIVGTGVDQIITVTTTAVHNLTTGDIVNIVNTTNFNATTKTITVTDTTHFTYDLGSTGSATPETSGQYQTGNILTPDGVTVQLDGTVDINAVPSVTLIFDITAAGYGAWRVISGGGGGGATSPLTTKGDLWGYDTADNRIPVGATDGHILTIDATVALGVKWAAAGAADNLGDHTATQNVDFATFDGINIDRALFDQALGTTLGATDAGITSDAAGGLTLNVLSGQSYNFDVAASGTNSFQINDTSVISETITPVNSTVVSGDSLGTSGNEWAFLFTTDVVLKSGDKTSKVIFDGDATTPKTYFTGSATTGRVNFYSEIASVATNVIAFTNSNLELFSTTDFVMGTGQIKAGGATKGVENIGHLDFIDNTATPAAALSIYSDGTDLFANTGGGVKNLSDIGTGSGTSPPFDDNQVIIQDETDNTKTLTFNLSLNSTGDANLLSSATTASRTWTLPDATTTLGGLSVNQTWTAAQEFNATARSETNGASTLGDVTHYWDDVFSETLTLRGSGGNTSTSIFSIHADDSGSNVGMILQVPGFREVQLFSGTGELASFSSNGLHLHGRRITQCATITMQNITPSNSITVDVNGTTTPGLDFKNTTAGWYDFQLSSTSHFKINTTDIEVKGGLEIKSSDATEIGFQVTNTSITVGTEGTVQLPWLGSSSTTKGAADTDFGNAQACCGINEIGGTPTLLVRKSDGSWWGVSLTSFFP